MWCDVLCVVLCDVVLIVSGVLYCVVRTFVNWVKVGVLRVAYYVA